MQVPVSRSGETGIEDGVVGGSTRGVFLFFSFGGGKPQVYDTV